ncbi:hypothetical protein CNA05900 [Cryptococcus deneoformans JEC21]|uniref:Uncharacterized protein n=1 Tax=Cryptococcus deneoformans (strain JEC21 / ATCC MYA-565) TaxID=214684 RepID=Q5KNN3_CRYD1|nr:hypothetical protein CNA05900 [Cryptococcus neoformans var. neoformans JEC21]AAW41124.1 hypothetical protein CNA05900 [Cryptococcus neoformans var. neoformans JEC21]
MDRGAARSRKRSQKDIKPSAAHPPAFEERSKPVGPEQRPKKQKRPERGEQSKDPSLYKPKAVRTSAALIYSEAPCALPPPTEQLENVRRIDLSGSEAKDVSWLNGLGVTWLSLANCPIQQGWEAVGTLSELTVLNISGCGLKKLPVALKSLSKLKAIVAMNNEWTELDEEVVGAWTDLNSLIASHSPNLVSLPSTLSNLHHLSKLTFSHCPRLAASSLPNLSSLPLLRDVKMNNLPNLTILPSHISSWGKGDMSVVGKGQGGSPQYGDGLQVLDLGNCSLAYHAIASLFGLTASKRKPLWPHLRSLSLHSNPIATTHPQYSELLQASPDLPNLQIIDAHRVVERKRKGERSESKADRRARERKEGQMKPSGANVGSGKMRKWGQVTKAEEDGDTKQATDKGANKPKLFKGEKTDVSDSVPSSRKRKHGDQTVETVTNRQTKLDVPKKRKKHESAPYASSSTSIPNTITNTLNAPAADPKELHRLPHQENASNINDYRKEKSAVVGLIEVNKDGGEVKLSTHKRKKIQAKGLVGKESTGGVDLKEVFGKGKTAEKEKESESTGLGVGEW